MRKDCITGSEAAELAVEKRARLNLLPPQSGQQELEKRGSDNEAAKQAPPRLRQPARRGEVLVAPKAELQAHKAAFRKLFGDTLSDEFVDEMLNLLGLALAPGAWDQLEPGTLNAAIAIIASVKPQTELEALLAFQIVATGFAGLKFLQRGQSHLEEVYIGLVSDRLAGAPRAAASTSRNVDSVAGLAGSTSTAIRVAAGTSWRRSSNRLAANSPARKLIPVMLPP